MRRMPNILTNQYSIKEVIPFPTLKPIKNIDEEKTK